MCQDRAINWLERVCPESAELGDNEKREIRDFALIWSFFEQTCLNANAGMPTIRQFVGGLDGGSLEGFDIDEHVAYFRDRYYEQGQPTHRYQHLHLDRSDSPPEVDEMIRGDTQTKERQLIGCLGIVFRYRNNLFHGEKWAYHLRDQEINFRHSSALLQQVMDRDT